MSRAPLDWTRTGTLQAMGEWVRVEVEARVLVAVRPGDAVMLIEPGIAPLDAAQAVRRCVPILAGHLVRARQSDRRARLAGIEHARVEWLRSHADAICVVAIRAKDSTLLIDERCAPADAERLVLECVGDLAAGFGASAKYKGARVVFDGVTA